jgi:hypothetical protein
MVVETVTETRVVVDWCAVAAALEPKIMQRMRDAYDYWNDIEMRAMVVADAGASMRVAELLATGRVDQVNEALWYMDTSPREELICMIESIVDNEEAIRQIW